MVRQLFKEGETVSDPKGVKGIVLSRRVLEKLQGKMRLRNRAGAFFSVGCCPVPDYISKIPVLFEDQGISIMKSTGIRKIEEDGLKERLSYMLSQILEE
ncbi:MAG: hypothetical protein ACK4WB_05520 [Desulfatiglandales bacterium]